MSLTALAYLMTFAAGSLASLIRGPIYGLFLYFFVFYVNSKYRWWGDEIPDIRWSLIAGVITLLSVYLHRNKLEKSDGHKPWYSNTAAQMLILYAAWMWIQVPWALVDDWHMYGTTLFTKYVILFYLIYVIIDDERKMLLFSLVNVVGCAYLGWVALGEGGGRLEGVGGPGANTANTLAGLLGVGAMFGGLLLMHTERKAQILVFLSLPLIINGIILAGSRGGFLALIAAGISLFYLKPTAKKRELKILAVLGITMFIMLAHQQLWDRLATLLPGTEGSEETAQVGSDRLHIMEKQLKMFLGNPMGYGHRGTKALSPIYIDERYLTAGGRSSHNTYLAVLVDQGIIGFVLYMGLLIWVFRSLIRLKKLDSEGLEPNLGLYRAAIGSSIILLCVAGIFTNFIRGEMFIWCVALLASLMNILSKKLNKKPVAMERRFR